jgi:outer membrane receptor for ferrienterochelin and colicins
VALLGVQGPPEGGVGSTGKPAAWAALAAGFSIGGAYTYLDAKDDVTGLRLTNRNRHMGSARLGFESARLGLRANLRGSFFSSWIASRSTTAAGVVEVPAASFSLFDAYAAKRIAGGLEAFVAVDNLTDDRDPNTGRTSPSGQPLPIYRAEVGRTYRAGVRVALAKPARSGSGR